MTLQKPRRFTEWVRLFSPAMILIAAVALGFYAEGMVPRRGLTAFTVTLIGLVPALVISIAAGCWMLRVGDRDDFGKAVKGGLIGLGLLAINILIALPAIILVGKVMRPLTQ